jgi:hypothetical protein
MSEQRLKDFAETAEWRVPVPDLEELTSRGRDLRRARRIAVAGVVAAAVAVVAVGVALGSSSPDDRSGPPAVDPNPPPAWVSAEELSPRSLQDTTLLAGRDYVVHPWQLTGTDDVVARFRVPGRHWVWREDGAARPLTPGRLFPDTREPYARVGVAAPDRVPVTGCEPAAPRWTPLAERPLAAAQQIGQVPGVVLEQRARPTSVFGHEAAHVRLSVPHLCAEYGDIIVWGQGSTDFPGTVDYPGQVLVVWVVDDDVLQVVVHTEVSAGLPESVVEQTRALFESITLDRVHR